jgi:hypothetical protein
VLSKKHHYLDLVINGLSRLATVIFVLWNAFTDAATPAIAE